MTSAARDTSHYRSGVYGNVAYDLERELRESELRHAGERRREAASRAKEEVRVRSLPRVRVRERQHVSPLSVAGCLAVAAMAVLVLFSYVQLTALSSDVVDLRSQLSVLKTDNRTLTAQYQQMYDLSTVKEVAEAAGMSKPGTSQVYYVDLSDGDSAVVYQQKKSGIFTGIGRVLRQGAASIAEYFGAAPS